MYKLKQIRERNHLTQEELSDKSGISVRTIQRIEAGTKPKGYTLKALCKALVVQEDELLEENHIAFEESSTIIDNTSEDHNFDINQIDYSIVKLINLSSILFIVLPPLNIILPLILKIIFKEKSELSKQIINVQIIWTILAPIIFFIGIFLKLGREFTIILLVLIVLSNVVLILTNAYQIDKSKNLLFKLNFSII